MGKEGLWGFWEADVEYGSGRKGDQDGVVAADGLTGRADLPMDGMWNLVDIGK